MPFDLSKVIFVATANRAQPIPPALLDRMEVIELPGYTPEEKLKIAMKHLMPRVLDQHGLSSEFLQIPEVCGPIKILIFFWRIRPDTLVHYNHSHCFWSQPNATLLRYMHVEYNCKI